MLVKKKKSLIATLGLVFALVLTSTILSLGNKLNALNASAYTAGATPASIGELTLANYGDRTDGQVFDPVMIKTLYAKLAKNSAAMYTDVVNAAKTSSSSLTGKNGATDIQNYSMNFQKITTNNGGSPLTVTLGGLKWNVVYLTTNTVGSTGGDGDLIATLWMSENHLNNVQWNIYTDTTTDATKFSSNNYSASKIRTVTLNGGSSSYVATAYAMSSASPMAGTYAPENRVQNMYANFTLTNAALAAGGKNGKGNNLSLVDYLATPSQVKYQETETFYWSYNGNHNVSDAWGTPTSGSWYTSGTVVMANVAKQSNYAAWANDYVWLPSMTETGFYNGGVQSCVSLWGINNTDLLKAANNYWTRSGFQQGAGNVQYITSGGSGGNTAANSNTLSVRPALHLNLTKINDNLLRYADPQDIITPVYDGNPQTPAGLAANAATKPSWWNADFADNTKFQFEYYDSSNTKVTEMKNAGDYWVKLSFTDSNMKGIFDGASNTSDADHQETTRERWFKFKINPKPIEVDFITNSDGTKTAKAKNDADIAMSDSDRKPVFAVDYTSSDNNGYTFNHPNVPDKVGAYTVTAVITNTPCNFTIDKTKSYTTTYSKGKEEVTKPIVNLHIPDDVYCNVDYEYVVSNYDDTLMTMTLPVGVSYNASTRKLKIRNADSYEIKFEVKTPSEYCWAGDDPEDAVKYTVTIQRRQISVTGFNTAMLNSDAVKNALDAKVPNANIINAAAGNPPEIMIMFGYQDGLGNEFNFYPDSPGKYKARLELAADSAKNYELDDDTAALVIEFDVTGAVTFQPTDLVWMAAPTSGGDPIVLVSPYELPFIIGGYTISIDSATKDKMPLRSKGVKIFTDDETGDNGYSGDIQKTDVGNNYVASVRLVNYDDTLDSYDQTFSLTWKIVPHKVTKPSYSGDDIVFSKDPTDLVELYGLPSDWADYVEFDVEKDWSGTHTSDNAIHDVGTYIITIKIKSSMLRNVTWSDSSPLAFQQTIKIVPRTVEIMGWDVATDIPSPQTNDPNDLDYLDYVYTKQDGSSATYEDVIASPNTTFNIQAVSKYGENVIIATAANVEDNETFSTPGNAAEAPTLVAKPTIVEDIKEYTGEELTFELSGFDGTIMILNGMLTATEVGKYTVTISFRDGVNYRWDDNTRKPLTLEFSVTAASEPPAPAPPKEPNFFEKLIASHFPLWQVITMAVAGILTVIFLIKSIQYGKRAKKVRGETKKLKGTTAYAALLPVFASDIVALNLSNKIWSIMAFAMAGLAILMFVIALITRGSWKKALREKEEVASNPATALQTAAAMQAMMQGGVVPAGMAQGAAYGGANIEEILRKHDEERRREEDERRRQDEERHRQEMDAMKMMFAGMMGRQQMDNVGFDYASVDDTDLLVQKVIAGLLPVVQQMVPEPTAYLTAPQEQNEELLALVEEQKAIVEEQNEEIRSMAEQMSELQSQLAAMHEMADAVIIPENNEELIAKMTDMQQQIAELSNNVTAGDGNNDELLAELNALREQIAEISSGAPASESNNEELLAEMSAMREQIANLENQTAPVSVAYENSGEMRAMADEVTALRQQVAILSQGQYDMSVGEEDDEDIFDDEEEWDSILDEDEDDNFVESVIVETDGTVRKIYPNFRMRLKESSDKNREWYAAIKNLFCSQKGVTYRVYKRVEKIRYQGQVIAVIGIAKRSLKLWLALKPYEYDARRYHHRDVSDKPRFVEVPLYVRVGSDRALLRAEELILALFQEQAMEARKRYTDRGIQELIFTLKYNKLLAKKDYKQLLSESVHVHDCDVLDDEMAQKCIEKKMVDVLDDSVIETVKLDDIDAKFLDGNRVTLDKLKKVGLVSEQCTGYTVAADKRLTKPLIIVANDFTLPAVKMIALTGGRVIKLNQI